MAAAPSRQEHTVLVVDDTEAIRYATARTLRGAGYRTIETDSGSEALELAEFASAAVLDVHLPDVNGLEVVRLLRAHPRTAAMPIVHLSMARIQDADRRAGLGAGADDYLVGPVEPTVLVDTLDRVIAQRAAAQVHAGGDDWVSTHRRLLSHERLLFTLAERFTRGLATEAELDAVHERVRELRGRAERLLQEALSRMGALR